MKQIFFTPIKKFVLKICIALNIVLVIVPITFAQQEQTLNDLFGPKKSPSGLFLATFSTQPAFQAQVQLKKVRDGVTLWTYPEGKLNCIWGLAWSPDSKKIVVAADGMVRVLNANNGHQDYVFEGIKGGEAFAPSWSKNGKYIVAIGTKSGDPFLSLSVIAWDAETRNSVMEISDNPGTRVLWAPDSKRIAFNTREHKVQIWDVPENKQLRAIPINGGGTPPFDWSPDGRYLVVADWQFTEAVIFDSVSGSAITRHPFHRELAELTWAKDGKSIFCDLRGGHVQNWQLQFGTNGLLKPALAKTKVLGESGYMPSTLDECFTQLNVELSPPFVRSIKNKTEKGLEEYHFDLEMWLRNRFDLRGHSKLANNLESIGIMDAESMSEYILHSYWQKLNGFKVGVPKVEQN